MKKDVKGYRTFNQYGRIDWKPSDLAIREKMYGLRKWVRIAGLSWQMSAFGLVYYKNMQDLLRISERSKGFSTARSQISSMEMEIDEDVDGQMRGREGDQLTVINDVGEVMYQRVYSDTEPDYVPKRPRKEVLELEDIYPDNDMLVVGEAELGKRKMYDSDGFEYEQLRAKPRNPADIPLPLSDDEVTVYEQLHAKPRLEIGTASSNALTIPIADMEPEALFDDSMELGSSRPKREITEVWNRIDRRGRNKVNRVDDLPPDLRDEVIDLVEPSPPPVRWSVSNVEPIPESLLYPEADP